MSDTDKPLQSTDYVIEEPPASLPDPLQRWLADLTYREAHSMELGIIGLFVGVAVHLGLAPIAAPLVAILVAIALGLRTVPNGSATATAVIRREPWYFLLAFAATATLAFWTAPLALA